GGSASGGGSGLTGGVGASTSTGGTPNSGGAPNSGGTPNTGGTPGSGGGGSGGTPSSGGAPGGGGGSATVACCAPTTGTPGCGDATVQNCVCAQDNYCCQTEWDQVCVNEVSLFGCGTCGGGAGGTSGSGGSGGGTSSGGTTSTGGATGSGGSSSTGGATGSGGSGGFAPGAVTWIEWPAQQSQTNGAWSSYMTDVIQHLPASYGNTYYDADKVTHVHETTHGINSHLRNYKNTTGKKANGFYVGHNKGVIIVEPNIWKSDANSYVPQSLRESRYSLYLQGSQAWNDTPMYLWDEWVAYTNGTESGLNMVLEGKWKDGWRDVFGSLEFTVYGIALAMAVEAKDPNYFSSYAQFREFLKWNTERSMKLYFDTHNRTEFKWNKVDDYYNKILTSPDAANLRAFVVKTYGSAWAKQVMGI
ncbi:MAG TPA: hypothetical protein PKD61_34525, partial [Polyangiaceae bacterium]|nr:hypothetical protein [Polyangiaceae bacterium]